MSSPGNVRQKHGRDNDEHEGDSDDLNLQKSLPSSSQQKTPTKPVFGNKVNSESVKTSHHMSFSNKYDLVFPEPVESDNDETLWDVRDLSHRNRWSSVDPESAGPSKTVSTVLSESNELGKLLPSGYLATIVATPYEKVQGLTEALTGSIGKAGCIEVMGNHQVFLKLLWRQVSGSSISQYLQGSSPSYLVHSTLEGVHSLFFPVNTKTEPLSQNSTDTAVSERELTQLAQIRPLIFNSSSRAALRDCLKALQKKEELDIIREFLELEEMIPPDDFKSGYELQNRDKNRYRDILPYDSTRVPLGKNKDYINASYIRIVNHEEEYFYIATQGPLPDTIEDFWQMVLENNCNVIAMITREIEGGVIKCCSYWPVSLKEPLEFKHFHVLLENFQITQYFVIRIFQIVKKSTGKSHSVKHLQFIKWPDHGTPASADFFIKYVRYVRKSHITGPLLVHCSAGVGRTGVFICVDVVFCTIEKNYSFNIMNIVTQMRKQRFGMIQTKEQYQFCYEIVLEVLQNLLALN